MKLLRGGGLLDCKANSENGSIASSIFNGLTERQGKRNKKNRNRGVSTAVMVVKHGA